MGGGVWVATRVQLEAVRLDCLEARIRLQQVDELKLELAQAHQSVEAHRRECESLTQEIATLRGENNVLRDQGKQLLAQVTAMAPRSRATSGRAGKSTS
jgi:regulator of replication initiation timing